MTVIGKLLENNQKWAAKNTRRTPDYFVRQAAGQKAKCLFIGCSDLGVTANELFGLTAGEAITHSNVANLVVHSDMGLLSVLQYAVQQCGVEDIIVCGNYDCGGVAAAMSPQQNGLLDSWLTQVRDVVRLHEKELLRIADDQQRLRRLVELNVVEQVRNLAKTNIVQNALQGMRTLRLHGLVFNRATGLVKNLDVAIEALGGWASIYETLPVAPVLTYSRGPRPLAPAARAVARYRHSA